MARDDLFEQPGERPPTDPLPDRSRGPAVAPAPETPRAAPPTRAPSSPKATGAAPKAAVAARPASGCVPVDLAGLRAALVPTGRPLVVNHWATWCDPCVEELPRLVRAHAGAGETADFLGVSWDLFDHPGEPRKVAKEVARFADGMGVGYPSVLYVGEPRSLFEALHLEVELIPQTFVYAADGTLLLHHAGVVRDEDVPALLAALRGQR